MKRIAVLAATLFLLAGVAGAVGTAGADTGPLADAGLDQEVPENTTVQLDGTGSSHPDGSIEGYEWSIETPTSRTITPACPDCARTRFRPTTPGRYDVTVTVSDDEGRTDRDTLYVYVNETGPTVDLSGPTAPPVDEPREYNASAATTNAELRSLAWTIGNRTVTRETAGGERATSERLFSFDDARTYRLEVVVRDTGNRTARDTLRIEPVAPDTDDHTDTTDGARPETSSATSEEETPTTTTRDCVVADVVKNPVDGDRTAAAVTCGDGSDINDQYADETCSADLDDCEYVEPEGQNRDIGDSGSEHGLIDVTEVQGQDTSDGQDNNLAGLDDVIGDIGGSGGGGSNQRGRSGANNIGSSGGSAVDWSDVFSGSGSSGGAVV